MSELLERTVERLVDRVANSHFGKYRGVVTDIDDPDDRCRIRATVPALLGEVACGWAMPAVPFAGDGHGIVTLPTIGSGVWIEFEAGQLDFPIWSGAWWGPGERPEPKGPGVRVFVSTSGHKIVLDDDNDEVRISHGSGPKVVLSRNDIKLTVGGCEIVIGNDTITLNQGILKVGLAGVSLANGAMSLGVPPT